MNLRTQILLIAVALLGGVWALWPDAPAIAPNRIDDGRNEEPARDDLLIGTTDETTTVSLSGRTAHATPEPTTESTAEGQATLFVDVEWPDGEVRGRKAQVFVDFANGTRRQAWTDQAGRATFHNARPGPILLSAISEPPTLRGANSEYVEPNEENEWSVSLVAGISIAGRVVDASSGAPIEGAQVGVAWGVLNDGRPGVMSAETDADGRYETWWGVLGPKDDLKKHAVAALADGYAVGLAPMPAKPPLGQPAVVDFRLKSGGAVEGTVHDVDGMPAVGMFVRLQPQAGVWKQGNPWKGFDFDTSEGSVLRTRADANGRFRIGGLSFGEVYAAIAYDDGVPVSQPAYDIAPTADTPIAHARLTVRALSTLHLRILGDDGKTLPRAHIDMDSDGGTLRPNADGVYSYEDIASGRHRVKVEVDGLRTYAQVIETRPGEITLHEIRMTHGATISGVLVDAAGKPLAWARVRAWPERGLGPGFGSSKTDERGRFLITGLFPGLHHIRLGAAIPCQELEVEAPATDVRVVQVAHGTIRVTLDQEAPPKGMSLHISGKGRGFKQTVPRAREAGTARYDFEVPAGRHAVQFFPRGFAPFRRTVDVPAGGLVTENGTLQTGRSVVGRVLGSDDRPIHKAGVLADDRRPNQVYSDKLGRFEVRHLGDEPIEILIHASGYCTHEFHHDPTLDGELTIRLVKQTVVHGLVRDAQGRPSRVEFLWAKPRGKREPYDGPSTYTDDVGAFEFLVDHGPRRIEIERNGRRIPIADIEVPVAGRFELDLRLPPE